ncbi:glycosyltransferase [Dechloromonas sp. XY25]|uniref:Glycosyltransferase n=1 Tax=Dechloromonas hankyongensis TaxID=2908002 RepID=A0ABS9JZG0_9RHOO|nr:glycosyltransferase [Dechloromonas hankyongensis]MCG2576278.1 glycosyltransferase [Dechloromonas hankyongensis]
MKNLKPSVVMLTPDRQIDRRILLSADSLEAAGWEVTIIAMPLDEQATDDRRVVRIGSKAGPISRENRVLEAYRWIRGHLPMNGRLMRWMKRLTWRYLVDQESFYSKLFYSTASQYAPRVFVANDLPMLPVAGRLAKECGAKLVYDSHELYSEQEFSEREKRRWSEIEAKYIGACDVVITVNQSIATELEQRYGVSGVRVIYNAERTPQASIMTRRLHEIFGLPLDKKILLLQGGLSAGRNLEVLVDAMRYVQNTSVVLVVLGDGLLLCSLQKLARQQELKGRVYFHAAVPQNELLALTAAADAGVIPYQATCLNNHYCTPNKLFEFIAAGLPILATDLPEVRRLVEGLQIGLVGDTGSPQKLAALVDDFFSDEHRFATWKAQVKVARELICWEQEENKLVEIYGTLQ